MKMFHFSTFPSGFKLPHLAQKAPWKRVQDAPAGKAVDQSDRSREHPQDPDGRTHTGVYAVAPQHPHHPGPQHPGQLQRRAAQEEEEGEG